MVPVYSWHASAGCKDLADDATCTKLLLDAAGRLENNCMQCPSKQAPPLLYHAILGPLQH